MRAKILVGLTLAFLCCGLVRATNGIQPENSDDGGLFIPTVDEAWNAGNTWNSNSGDDNSWTTKKSSSAKKSRKAKTPSSRKTASTETAKSQEAPQESNSGWFSKPDQPAVVALIVLGGAAIVLIPSLLVIRRMRASRDRYVVSEVPFYHSGRARSSVPTVLAASLMHARHEAVTGAIHEGESQKTRRAA